MKPITADIQVVRNWNAGAVGDYKRGDVEAAVWQLLHTAAYVTIDMDDKKLRLRLDKMIARAKALVSVEGLAKRD